jgi:hypothetical protein
LAGSNDIAAAIRSASSKILDVGQPNRQIEEIYIWRSREDGSRYSRTLIANYTPALGERIAVENRAGAISITAASMQIITDILGPAICSAIILFLIQLLNYGLLVINYRAVAHGQKLIMVGSDFLCATFGFFVIRRIAVQQDAVIPWLGYAIGSASSNSLYLRKNTRCARAMWAHFRARESRNHTPEPSGGSNWRIRTPAFAVRFTGCLCLLLKDVGQECFLYKPYLEGEHSLSF